MRECATFHFEHYICLTCPIICVSSLSGHFLMHVRDRAAEKRAEADELRKADEQNAAAIALLELEPPADAQGDSALWDAAVGGQLNAINFGLSMQAQMEPPTSRQSLVEKTKIQLGAANAELHQIRERLRLENPVPVGEISLHEISDRNFRTSITSVGRSDRLYDCAGVRHKFVEGGDSRATS